MHPWKYPSVFENRPQLGDDLGELRNCQQLVDKSGDVENRQQPVDDIEVIFQIPWGHHVQILGKCKGNINHQCRR